MRDRDGPRALLRATLGEVDQELAVDVREPRTADRVLQPEQGVLLAPADAAAQFLQIFQMKIDEIAQRLPAGDRLRRWLLAAADPAFLLGGPDLGFGLETECV